MTDRPTALCVLGMSRTGTSLTARVLNLAGVYLGPEEELLGGELRQLPAGDRAGARAANPEGFWEHYRLMRLNERILQRLGGNWREPPRMPPGWEDSAGLTDEREQARSLLEETFAGHDCWGWKDPRNCLTLPFWRSLVPQLRCVVCVRNPLEVAASLAKRDGIPPAQGFELWATYMTGALANTADLPRLLVAYESYFDAGAPAVARLARFAGRDGSLENGGSARLEAAIDPLLRRNRAGYEDALARGEVPDGVAALYRFAQLEAGRLP